MAHNERTSKEVAEVASKLLKATRKDQVSLKEIKRVAASVLTQTKDRKR